MQPTREEILILRALKLLLEWQYWGRNTRETIKENTEIKEAIERVLAKPDKE